jgi:hypothetical protein
MRGQVLKIISFQSILGATFLLILGCVVLAVSATPDRYDPRHDPNFIQDASEKGPVNWEAIWGLIREFEGRSYQSVGASRVSGPFAMPQPWHYVQGAPSLVGSPRVPDTSVYGGVYPGTFYGVESFFPGWWGASPRIPWWSLIPPRAHHHNEHHHKWRGPDRHRGGQSLHLW